MTGHQLDIIWLQELNLVILYPESVPGPGLSAAAIIVKAEDGTDQFIPYDGYIEGAPISFLAGVAGDDVGCFAISVLGFADSGEPLEIAAFQLDSQFMIHDRDVHSSFLSVEEAAPSPPDTIDVQVVGIGEQRLALAERQGEREANEAFVAEGSSPDGGGDGEAAAIGFCKMDYEIEGALDYSQLLATFLHDVRQIEASPFTGYFITSVPRSGVQVGPAVQLKPLHHYQFGLALRTLLMPVDDLEWQEMDDPSISISPSPLEGAAILSRYKSGAVEDTPGFAARDVPEVSLYAGPSSSSVEFIRRNGFKVHWRRQQENWGPGATGPEQRPRAGEPARFMIEPLVGRDNLGQRDGAYLIHWLVEGAVPGDVVGVVFAGEHATVDLHIGHEGGGPCALSKEALFIFMGDEFVPLTDEIRRSPENLGLMQRLDGHIEAGLAAFQSQNSLKRERVRLATSLFERDRPFQDLLGSKRLEELAEAAPFGPELMVYRDHMMRLALSEQPEFIEHLFGASLAAPRGRLADALRFDVFLKLPALAHVLVFNKTFRDKFQMKPRDPQSPRKPLLEVVLSALFSERLIEWALRLKGESQAILWHLALKRPHMVERLYELKLEPDTALNPFDDRSLDHAEAALSESAQIDVAVLEKKVVPVLRAAGESNLLEAVDDFVIGLSYSSEGRRLNIGALSVCLGAVEQAQELWEQWVTQAKSLFTPLIEPLSLDLPGFGSDLDFAKGNQINELRRDIGLLAQRVMDEKSLDLDDLSDLNVFIDQIEAEVFLKEIHNKLDLALKYHHDLTIGVKALQEHFSCDEALLARLDDIKEAEWPRFDMFGATFSGPYQHEQLEMQAAFEAEVHKFADRVHPDDELFLKTFKNSLASLEAGLSKLHWLEVGKGLETRRAGVQAALKKALLEVGPASSKLRRSRALRRAVNQMIIAERMGPAGWPLIVKSLDAIDNHLTSHK